MTAFAQELGQLGWIADRNVKIDSRWPATDSERVRRYVAELVALAPDVIVTSGTVSVAALIEATRTVPIVFAGIPDPVGRVHQQPVATRRERYRFPAVRIRPERKMAGDAQADRAANDARGGNP